MGSEFDGLMEYEMQKMTYEELERHDLEQWNSMLSKYEINSPIRIDGASMLNGFMKSHISLPKSELFFNN